MDERFCYNAHQPITNMVIVFTNTVFDHKTRIHGNYFTTNKGIQGQCRIVLIELFIYMQNNTGAPFPNVLW